MDSVFMSSDSLRRYSEECHKKFINRTEDKGTIDVLVCGGTGCRAGESLAVMRALEEERDLFGLNHVKIVQTGCFGFCERGPIVKIMPDKSFYVKVTPESARDIIRRHVAAGEKVEELLYKDPQTNLSIEDSDHIPFYKKQLRVALRNCGLINPEALDEALACGAFQALSRCFELTPPEVVDIIKKSGLRGRGGAGFPTGVKWEIASKVVAGEGQNKYVVCNADEGDPGAFMDRSIMEGDPFSVIEGMAICGYAIGASKGLVYIRAEYPLAVERLHKAILETRKRGLIGENILGSGWSFDIDIRFGAGAFVCGEETALIHSMEGKRGEPTIKPPYPAERGYKDSPTNVNNVETLANIPVIITRGAEWFSSIGTPKSAGTKVFALAGKINNVGLIEVPMGTTLREVIFDIGGGIKDGKRFKAVQTGGPSGGCLTDKHLDLPIDFDTLVAAGSMMGSGGMIVMDEDDCMVSVAKFYLDFTVDESCGKCAPCRIGNKRLSELLGLVCSGKADSETLEQLRNIAVVVKDTALCGLGQTSPNPVLSTLEHFIDEYNEHINEHLCRAKKCRALTTYYIDPDKCVGCTLCARNCPVAAISGERKQAHTINKEKCIRCGECASKCKFNAIRTM